MVLSIVLVPFDSKKESSLMVRLKVSKTSFASSVSATRELVPAHSIAFDVEFSRLFSQARDLSGTTARKPNEAIELFSAPKQVLESQVKLASSPAKFRAGHPSGNTEYIQLRVVPYLIKSGLVPTRCLSSIRGRALRSLSNTPEELHLGQVEADLALRTGKGEEAEADPRLKARIVPEKKLFQAGEVERRRSAFKRAQLL
jgi:hypothetical protein